MEVSFHQKAIILNKENKILALKASYKGLRWDLPGGAVEIPENHEAALKREVKEETGLEIDTIKPLMVETGFNKDNDTYVIFIGFACKATTDTILLSSEHTEHRWVSKEEFLNLDTTPYLKDFVKQLT